jgi:rRNA maturation endonuclease Nob1
MELPKTSLINCTQCDAEFNINRHHYCPKCGYEGDVELIEGKINEEIEQLNRLNDEFDPDEL